MPCYIYMLYINAIYSIACVCIHIYTIYHTMHRLRHRAPAVVTAAKLDTAQPAACQQLSPYNPSFEAARSPSHGSAAATPRETLPACAADGWASRNPWNGAALPKCNKCSGHGVLGVRGTGYGAGASPHAAGAAAPPPGSAQRCERAPTRPASPGPRLRRHGEGRNRGLAEGGGGGGGRGRGLSPWRPRRRGCPRPARSPPSVRGRGSGGAPWRRWGRGGALGVSAFGPGESCHRTKSTLPGCGRAEQGPSVVEMGFEEGSADRRLPWVAIRVCPS